MLYLKYCNNAQDRKCFEIDGHDSFQLAPLGVWECGGEFDEPNEWWKFDPIMGHIASMQTGPSAGPFVVTACS